MNTNKIITALVVLVLIVGGFVLFNGDDSNGGEPVGGVVEEVNYTDPKDGEIAVVGKLECLPLKSGAAPSGDNCVIGLRGNDGKFYALDNSKVEVIGKGLNPEAEVEVVGKYTAVDKSSEEAGIFAYDGVMATRVMQAAE